MSLFMFIRPIQISYTDIKRGSFFSFKPTGLEYFVEGLEVTVFSLIAAAGFFLIRLVTSLKRATT